MLAGVRLLQAGGLRKGFAPGVRLFRAGGGEPVPLDLSPVLRWVPTQAHGGRWLLLPVVPDGDPVAVTGVELATDPALKRLEVDAVDAGEPRVGP